MKKLMLILIPFVLLFPLTAQDADIVRETLTNGIPVYLCNETRNHVASVAVILEGHAQFVKPEQAGIEGMIIAMLARGSDQYDYGQIQRMMYEKSSALSGTATGFDYISYNLNTLGKYFDEMLSVFLDTLLHPAWPEAEFERVRAAMLMERQNNEQDPYSRASFILNEQFFEGHPYATDSRGTLISLQDLSLDDLKTHYAEAFTANRMTVVCVGDFETTALIKALNRELGRLPNSGAAIPDVGQFAPVEADSLIIEPFDASPGVAYVRGNFLLPAMGDPDRIPLNLAMRILDDILFEIVRTRNSACYSVWSNQFGYTAGYGSFGVYRTDVPEKIKALIDESVGLLADGRSLSAVISTYAADDSPGTHAVEQASFVPVGDTLPFYKAQYITDYYSSQQTNASITGQIASSLIHFDDPSHYTRLIDLVEAVTAEDIVRVTRAYLQSPVSWIVLGGRDILDEEQLSQSYIEY